jgi:glucose/mannose transport system substrate-binding protein
VTSGDPPTAAQLLGMNVQEWAKEGFLGNLNSVAQEHNWGEVVPTAVQDFGTHEGNWVAAPVNIHRPNWLWMNADVFEEHDVEPPTTWGEFNEVARYFQENTDIVPLAHGGQPWQDATVFDDVVLGLGGPYFYRQAILELDQDALTSDTMVEVFEQMRTIRGFVDPNFSGRDWNIATSMVLEGEAAMQLMGDWAKGEIVNAGMTPGEDILCTPAPGTDGSFLFNTDFFAMFEVGSDMASAQATLAESILEPNFQRQFNQVKGSVPARTDVSMNGFDQCARESMEDLQHAQEAGTMMGSLAHGHGQPSSIQRAMFDVITQHFNSNMSAERASERLAQAVRNAQ